MLLRSKRKRDGTPLLCSCCGIRDAVDRYRGLCWGCRRTDARPHRRRQRTPVDLGLLLKRVAVGDDDIHRLMRIAQGWPRLSFTLAFWLQTIELALDSSSKRPTVAQIAPLCRYLVEQYGDGIWYSRVLACRVQDPWNLTRETFGFDPSTICYLGRDNPGSPTVESLRVWWNQNLQSTNKHIAHLLF